MRRIRYFILFILLISSQFSNAQIAINTNGLDPDSSAILDLTSIDKGVLIPRMTSNQRITISSPAIGLLVFDITTESFWFHATTGWMELSSIGPIAEIIDTDNDTKIQVEESADEDIIRFDLGGDEFLRLKDNGNGIKMLELQNTYNNLFIGKNTGGLAYTYGSSGLENLFIGNNAGSSHLYGGHNTFLGTYSGSLNTVGNYNVFTGYYAGNGNTTGSQNSAYGTSTLSNNTTGIKNTALGFGADVGSGDLINATAIGANALVSQDSSLVLGSAANVGIGTSTPDEKLHIVGNTKIVDGRIDFENIGYNSAVGGYALDKITTGEYNQAFGHQALNSNTTGNRNTAIGAGALGLNTTGSFNIAIGVNAMLFNHSGSYNTIIGHVASASGNLTNATAIGAYALATKDSSVILGNAANVGIGTSAPDEKLHVVGNLKIEDGNQTNGYVLTSDTDGVASWQAAASGTLIADLDGDTKIQVEENADEDIIRFDLGGTEFLRLDSGRMEFLNTGYSIFIGEGAGKNDDYSFNYSTGIGFNSLFSNIDGFDNTSIGNHASYYNISGNYNSVVGGYSLFKNTTGSYNAAIGNVSLYNNLTGRDNTASGNAALYSNTTGSFNVAYGSTALFTNATGSFNTAIGYNARTGSNNLTNATAIGANALVSQDSSLVLGNAANVGIGTSTPDEKLHIVGNLKIEDGNQTNGYVLTSDANGVASWQDGGNTSLFEVNNNVVRVDTNQVGIATDDFVFGSIQLDNDGNVNHYSRMFFDKDKAAFRAGSVNNNNWNANNIGENSFAAGKNTKATGLSSTSLGNNTEASGDYSTTMGRYTDASDEYSTAMGFGSDASGFTSTAMGNYTEASGEYAVSIGSNTEASGDNSTAMGRNTEATGINSTAMGYTSKAIGEYSTAMGYKTKAEGESSFAAGRLNNATGIRSFAMGSQVTTIGSFSVGMGSAIQTEGNASIGLGIGIRTQSAFEVSVGSFNTEYLAQDSLSWNASDRLFNIGNGQSNTSRSDALIVYKSGDAILNGQLTLSNGNDSITFPNTDGADGQALTTDGNGVVAWEDIVLNTELADTDGDTKIQVEESADDDIIRFDLGGTEFFRLDSGRIEVLNTGNSIFIGENAGVNDAYSNNKNIGIGTDALSDNTTGYENIAIGRSALSQNTIGRFNAAVGNNGLSENIDGRFNSAFGNDALMYNSIGYYNTAVGYAALKKNTEGYYNSATGVNTLFNNTIGDNNIAYGGLSLYRNTTGSNNIGIGFSSLFDNLTGSENTAIGYLANVGSTYLTNATAIGANAIVNQDSSLILGHAANVGIGTSAPDEKLHIEGSIKMVDGNQAFGYILTSDANGTASWSTNAWDVVGNNLISNVSGNIGIAQNSVFSPATEFHILGAMRVGYNSQSNTSGYIDFDVDSNKGTINYKPYSFGNFGNLQLKNSGNTGLEITTSGEVKVSEAYKLPSSDGVNGQVLETDGNGNLSWTQSYEPIKASVTRDIANISSNTTIFETFTVNGASVGDVVQVSPGSDFPAGVVVAQAYVSAANTVRVNFRNTSGGGKNPVNMTFYFAVF